MAKNLIEMAVLCDTVNLPVIQFPGRRLPGILIQGDSLKSMAELADEIGERLRLGDFEEAKAIAEELSGQLGSRVKLYEEALNANSLATPYPKTR